MALKLRITFMSGLNDGKQLELFLGRDGNLSGTTWSISIGRADDNDIWLNQDTFASRWHALLHWRDQRWWLEDKNSTNGSFIENVNDLLEETRVEGTIEIQLSQWIRIGRTWLRVEME